MGRYVLNAGTVLPFAWRAGDERERGGELLDDVPVAGLGWGYTRRVVGRAI